jgi:methylglutaconyl-CoA hydratase
VSIQLSIENHLAKIQLSRSDKKNALSRTMIKELIQLFTDLNQEKGVRAVALVGDKECFSAGMDLREIHQTFQETNAFMQWQLDAQDYLNLIQKILIFPKPVIACVSGKAYASGAGLVLASDIVLADETAEFGFPEPKRGLVSGIASPLLTFRLGGSTASYLLLTAETISAERAFQLGLVNEIVKQGELLTRAEQLSDEIASLSPQSLLMTKRMLNETIGESLSSHLTSGAATSATSRTTEDSKEGVAAFLEKRTPDWF